MKKLTIFLLIFFIIIPCIFAQRGEFAVADRGFEIGIMKTSFGLSNDFLTTSDIFQETAIIDLDGLKKGFNMNLSLGVTPVYMSFNRKSNWGFGFSLGLDATGIIGLSGSMITFGEANDERSEISGAVFVETQFSTFFHVSKIRVNLSPSVFFPIMVLNPIAGDSGISYTKSTADGETILYIDYNFSVYTAFPLDSEYVNFSDIITKPGFDINLGVVYPLFKGLDLGLDIYNLPLVPAQMHNYMKISGRIGSEAPINIFDDGLDGFFNIDETETGENQIGIIRPFKLMAWAEWQLFGNRLLTIIPTLGFSLSDFYNRKFSLECGASARLDLANIFIATVGIGYYDRYWKNSIDLAFNLRLVEFNFGFDMRSSSFIQSWRAAGFGVNFGLKFGW